jgi:DNA-directed RNA polymerase specialized sigma24 family protein
MATRTDMVASTRGAIGGTGLAMEASAPPRTDSGGLDYEVLRSELRRALSRTRLGRFAGEAALSDEDVVQEAIARLIADVEATGEPPRDPGAWLFRAATNLIKDRIKLDAIHPTAAHEPASAVFEAGADEPALDELVEARLSQGRSTRAPPSTRAWCGVSTHCRSTSGDGTPSKTSWRTG